jgi:hypothetical protein
MSKVKRYKLPITDESFVQDFQQWWEECGQYVRSGATGYEVPFAFQAWRHLIPVIAELQAENEQLKAEKSARQALSIQLIDESRSLRAELEALKQKTDHIEGVLALVPERWVRVPVEPTEEMIRAALCSGGDMMDPRSIVIDDYRAMLAATPMPVVNQKLTTGVQQAEQKPVGYFVQPYTDRHEVIERVEDSCAGDDDVFPLYRHPPSVSGLVEALDGLVSASNSVNCSPKHLVEIPTDDDPCYWQRKEWVDWLKELGAAGASALAAHRAKGVQ